MVFKQQQWTLVVSLALYNVLSNFPQQQSGICSVGLLIHMCTG